MALSEYDELNNRYTRYFDKMEISQAKKDSRVEFANDVNEILLFIFSLMVIYNEQNISIENNRMYLINSFNKRYVNVIQKYMPLDDYLRNYALLFSANLIDATIRNAESDYYYSSDRAFQNSLDMANDVLNYYDYTEARKNGKTMKRWNDVRDNKERATHYEVGGTIIPIDDLFTVGDSLMRYPHDTEYGASASEIVNCRCSVEYL